MKTNRKLFKSTAVAALCTLLFELVFPLTARALTSGPTQPEFSSFEPVATTGMVNEFSGGFTYNLPVVEIPSANGGGYALSLSYHSGSTMEEEASWVGFGWTLNPGAITRSKRGLPDDYYDQNITYYNKNIRNVTYTVGYSIGAQVFSKDLNVGLNSMIRYNTYTGFSAVQSYSVTALGVASLGYNIDDGEGKFSATINPAALLSFNVNQKNKEQEKKATGEEEKLRESKEGVQQQQEKENTGGQNVRFNSAFSSYGIHQLAPSPHPTNTVEYTGQSYNIRFGLHISALPFIPGQIGGKVGISGSYSYQESKAKDERKVFGYMYSGDVDQNNAAAVMDYYTEKDAPYTKKDRYLGIPFGSADIYSLTGEGLGGGFRLHNRRAGMFRPNSKENRTYIHDAGGELGAGTDWGFGADVSSGKHVLKVGRWETGDTRFRFASTDVNNKDGEPYFFRFTGDKGGKVLFGTDDSPYRASLSSSKLPVVNVGGAIDTVLNNGVRSGRSSHISYTTIAEMRENRNGQYYRTFTKDVATRSFIDFEDNAIQKCVGEISVVKENGIRYVYGLPVFARNERNMQLGMGNYWIGAGKKLAITYSSWAHEDKSDIAAGEVRKAPYPTMHLLTQIVTPDYVDRTNDGPTPDDFGGYTKFNYVRRAGGTTKSDPSEASSRNWYRWRTPYGGLYYNPGKLVDGRDDRGSVASGEKEIYYLESVETKTHIAYFITNKTDKSVALPSSATLHLKGSGKERLDGYEAYNDESNLDNEIKSATQPGSRSFTGFDGVWHNDFAGKRLIYSTRNNNIEWPTSSSVAPRPNKLCYLERIEIYAKDEAGYPVTNLKKIHFEYDYSLMRTETSRYIDTSGAYKNQPPDTIYNAPTALNSAYGLSARSQDLYDAHQGNAVAVFRHGKLTLKKVWSEYEGVVNAKISPYIFEYDYKKTYEYDPIIRNRYPAIVQHGTPFLDSLMPDGFYYMDRRDQNPTYSETNTDRWGQYLYRYKSGYYWSNYESYTRQHHESRYDPAAWQLKVIKLPSGGEIHVQYEQHDYSYVQDRPAMAMVRLKNIDDTHWPERRYYLDIDRDLDTSIVKKEELTDVLRQQFINGGEKIFFKFLYRYTDDCGGDLNTTSFPSGLNDFISGYSDILTVNYDNNGVYLSLKGDYTPNKLAREYARVNKVDNMDCNTPQLGPLNNDYTGKGFWLAALEALPGMALVSQAIDGLVSDYAKPYTHFSYFRIPLSVPKKGGGIRVKRILMYDEGLEEGDAVLYGSEYVYKTERRLGNGRALTISSGVATNEPGEGREENSLVHFLPKRDELQWYEKLAGGSDLEQFEGPIGESILPAPSIGYSRVVVKSIHSGKTSMGFAVTEYHTARDFPFRAEHTDIGQEAYTPNPIISLLTNTSTSRYWVTQGYSFILNSMHGQVRKIEKYGGRYEQPDTWYLVESQEFEYYKPGEKVPVLTSVNSQLVLEDVGKEMEVLTESRHITDVYDNYALSFDAGITLPSAFLLPLPFGTFSFRYTLNDKALSTHVISKVISYPVIQKSVRTVKDGIVHTEEYIAFNPETGEPVITLSGDGFHDLNLQQSAQHNGQYAQYTISASSQYPQMGQKARNERYVVKNRGVTYNNLTRVLSFNTLPFPATLYAGDLIKIVKTPSLDSSVFHIDSVASGGGTLYLAPLSYMPAVSWSGSFTVDVEVIRSGRTNQLAMAAGHLTTYGVSKNAILNSQILANITGNVVSATATTFGDVWPYDELIFGTTTGANNYEKGVRGKWRPLRNYVYRQSLQSSTAALTDRIYKGGTMTSFSFFNWQNTSSNTANWLASTTVTKYSPHGEPIEEIDILGIPSASRFAHSNMVPAIVAKNAEVTSVSFQSFEDGQGNTSLSAHSGRYAYALSSGVLTGISTLTGSPHLRANGISLKYWVKSGLANPCTVFIGSLQRNPRFVAQTGEWKLYEAIVGADTLANSGSVTISFQAAGANVLIDDVRLQPLTAQATCFVYDKATLRLMTQFDDQHFGMFFQYNGEGKLVRKLKETERGLKTVQEAQYHIPLVSRENAGGNTISLMKQGRSNHRAIDMQTSTPQYEPVNATQGAGGAVDLLNLNITPEQRQLRLLGIDSLMAPASSPASGKERATGTSDTTDNRNK